MRIGHFRRCGAHAGLCPRVGPSLIFSKRYVDIIIAWTMDNELSSLLLKQFSVLAGTT